MAGERAHQRAVRRLAQRVEGKCALRERDGLLSREVREPTEGGRDDEFAEARALEAFYPRLGDALKQRFGGWTACLFSGDLRLGKLIGLKSERRIPLWNGAIECRLFVYRVVEGRMRRQ